MKMCPSRTPSGSRLCHKNSACPLERTCWQNFGWTRENTVCKLFPVLRSRERAACRTSCETCLSRSVCRTRHSQQRWNIVLGPSWQSWQLSSSPSPEPREPLLRPNATRDQLDQYVAMPKCPPTYHKQEAAPWGGSSVQSCRTTSVKPDPPRNRLRRHSQEVDLRAIVSGEMLCRLRAPAQPQQREHGSCRTGRAAPRPLEVSLDTDPRSAACIVSRSGVPSQTPVAQASTTCR